METYKFIKLKIVLIIVDFNLLNLAGILLSKFGEFHMKSC
jgi:hypothetical protein